MEWTRAPVAYRVPSYRDENRSRLTSIMESLAKQSGDLEQLVAVLASALGSAHKYLRIAESLSPGRQARGGPGLGAKRRCPLFRL